MPSVRRQLIDFQRSKRAVDVAIGLGFLVGGQLTAIAAVVVGSLATWAPAGTRHAVAVAVVGVLVARDAGVVRVPLPERRRLIPSPRLDLAFPWGTFAFAAELGLGWRTAVPTSAPYGVVAVVALAASFPAAGVAAAGWALGRSVPIAISARRRATGAAEPSAWPVPSGRRASLAALVLLLAGTVAGAVV